MDAANHSMRPAASRREFLANLVLGAGVALGLGGLAFRFAQFLYPVIPPVKLVQVLAGKTEDIPNDGVRAVKLPLGPVMLSKTGAEIRALSGICTHLGCVVQWKPEIKRFVCPCHQGVYNIDGQVISGPPPRPLQSLKVVIKGDQVLVVMEEPQKENV